MNNLSKLFMGFAALAMFSCSNDEPVVDGGDLPGQPSGENLAYMTIRLQDAGARGGRATTDGGLENGNASEHAILNVDKGVQFFFFEENGAYCGMATPWTGGKDNGDHGSIGNNVEFKGNAVIVLDKVTSKAHPNYILTVLNAPKFTPEATLDLTAAKLATWNTEYKAEGADKEDTYFVMSTSSYGGTDAHHDAKYFATLVNDTDFATTPEAATEKQPVDIYVERLAAKVELFIGAANGNDLRPVQINGKTYYRIDATVSGNDNGSLEGNEPTGATDIYVDIQGWSLTNMVKDSYISKQINDWTGTGLFTNWNDPTNYRSYWGKSVIYNGFDDQKLTRKNFAQLTSAIGGAEYCNENTMPVYTSPYTQATSVLVKAIACDVNGKPLDLVRYHGLLFNKDDFFKYVLNSANADGNLNYYTATTTSTPALTPDTNLPIYDEEGKQQFNTHTTYTQVPFSWFTFDVVKDPANNAKTGVVKVVIDEVNIPEGTDIYVKEVVDGKTVYTKKEISASIIKASVEKTILNLDQIEAFTGGAMYYTIPVEHLGASEGANKTDEGYYGVVRNHWYRLTINKLINMGHGVYDPDGDEETEIVPWDPTDDEYYYLGATINILSWKIVNQGVDL